MEWGRARFINKSELWHEKAEWVVEETEGQKEPKNKPEAEVPVPNHRTRINRIHFLLKHLKCFMEQKHRRSAASPYFTE